MAFFRYAVYVVLGLCSATYFTQAGFLSGTIVQTPENETLIDQLVPGDYVVSYTPTHTYASGCVTATYTYNMQHLVCIYLPDTHIIMDRGQWVYIADEDYNRWIRADQLLPGQYVVTIDHHVIPIEDIVYEISPDTVYDLSVYPYHTYCVSKEKIVVHNLAITIPVLAWGAGSVAWFPGVNLAALGVSAGIAGGI